MRGCHWMVASALAVMATGCTNDGTTMPDPVSPAPVTVYTFGAPQIAGPIQNFGPKYQSQTGVQINLKTQPDFSKLFPEIQTQATRGGVDASGASIDVILGLEIWMADMVNLGYNQALDSYINRDMADAQLGWSDIIPGIKLKNNYGGRYYTLMTDNDNHLLFYRKDILSDPAWQAKYSAANGGMALPNPPKTMDELLSVAKFFSGQNWNGDPTRHYGFVTNLTKGNQLYWYIEPWAAPYAVIPSSPPGTNLPPPAQGMELFDLNMTPLVNTPGFVTGVAKWLEMIACCTSGPGTTGRADVITQFTHGHALMAIDWGDIGPLSNAADSVVKDKVGFAQVPGSSQYYDWQAKQWVNMPAGMANVAPVHPANGWSFFLTSTSKNKEEAWKFMKYMISPEITGTLGADPMYQGAFQPWRQSQYTNTAVWTKSGWSADTAQAYTKAVLDATNHPNAVIDVRLPGADQYGAALENHLDNLVQAISGTVAPAMGLIQAEMDACAKEWNTITTQKGLAPQIKAYKAHLGLP